MSHLSKRDQVMKLLQHLLFAVMNLAQISTKCFSNGTLNQQCLKKKLNVKRDKSS